MRILLSSSSLGTSIPIFRLLNYLSLGDHIPVSEGIPELSLIGGWKALFTPTYPDRSPRVKSKIWDVGNLLRRGQGQSG